MSEIMVVGSISTDFNVVTKKRPAVGETVRGESFSTSFGGKGANQAVAAARLGASVTMVGTVGNDEFGLQLIKNLENQRINVDYVEQIAHIESGSAHIVLSENDNSIIYIPGANNEFHQERILQLRDRISDMNFIIIQNEIPLDIIKGIIDIAYEKNVQVIYNPAPANSVSAEIIEKVTYLTPNESEFKILFPHLTIEEGLEKYPSKLIITLGGEGVIYHDGKKIIQIPSYKVEVKDTTGAGDTFNGALTYALSREATLNNSIKFANLAASIAIQEYGAQVGMPTLQEVKESDSFEEKWNIK